MEPEPQWCDAPLPCGTVITVQPVARLAAYAWGALLGLMAPIRGRGTPAARPVEMRAQIARGLYRTGPIWPATENPNAAIARFHKRLGLNLLLEGYSRLHLTRRRTQPTTAHRTAAAHLIVHSGPPETWRQWTGTRTLGTFAPAPFDRLRILARPHERRCSARECA